MKLKKSIILILIAISALVIIPFFIFWAVVNITNETNGSIISSGEKRNYLIHIPAGYKGDKPVPLVLCFHGTADWPSHKMNISGWDKVADREGFIVVFPEGLNFPKYWRVYSEYGSGLKNDPKLEVTFISDLINHLSAKYKIDPRRIYANGFSNGGDLTNLLACKLSDRIVAFATISGGFPNPQDCKPEKSVPFMLFHGTKDFMVPYEGGDKSVPFIKTIIYPSLNEYTSLWAVHNGCKKNISSKVSQHVSRIEYSSCKDNADVILYTIEGGGHQWPGGKSEFLMGENTQEINATELIWEFYKKYSGN